MGVFSIHVNTINASQHSINMQQHTATLSSLKLQLSQNLSLFVCSVNTVNTSNTVNTALTKTWEFFQFMSTLSTLVNTVSTFSNKQKHCHDCIIGCLKACLTLSAESTQSTQLLQKHGSYFNLCQHYQRKSTQHQHVATYSNTVITTASVVSKPVSLCLQCQHCSSYKNMQVFSIHSTLLTQLNLYLISGLS